MEVVRIFNNELSSLYEVKPPISKAKMTQITKSAIKGIKFYKHIVQSVEKFIQKCRPEYKVPGLYVVDSIVRQSRHQFGADKDVFGPRFVKNISTTFQHLFKCPEDDRPKIIRVLNLWQKNAVFSIDVIQPLLDMGHPNSASEWPLDAPAETTKESPAIKSKEDPRHKSSPWKGWSQLGEEQVHDNKPYAEMSTKNLEKFNKVEMSYAVKDDDTSHSSMFKNQVKLEKGPEETVKFNMELLDFDYGDEEDKEEPKKEDSNLPTTPNALALSMAQKLLSNPEMLRQLQQMAEVIPSSDVSIPSFANKVDDPETTYPQDMQSSPQLSLIPPPSYQQPVMSHNLHLSKSENDTDDRVLPDQPVAPRDLDERSLASVIASHDRLLPSMCPPAFQQTGVCQPPLPDKDDRIIPDPPLPSQDLDERSLASIIAPPDRSAMPPLPFTENANLMQFQYDKNGIPFQPPLPMMEPLSMDPSYVNIIPTDPHLMQNSQGDEDERVMYSMPGEPPLPPQDFDERHIMMPVEERNRKERSRSRSRSRGRSGRHRSRSRSPRRKRSRSRSRSRKNRSRSRERERERIREKERERERERERRRKGIPPIKKGCVSVCSTTLWLGHVPKACSEVDISDTFGQFGSILSIDMIPPRGCAYVVMDRRQDANRALQKLKNVKLQGSNIKMAWAPGKGVKGKEFKEYWEVELGVSYVPYEKIKEEPETLDLLEEGGFIDEDSLPEQLKVLRQQPDGEKNAYNVNNNSVPETGVAYNEIPATPNMVPPPIMPPTSVGLPMVLPHLMQPQFGLHLPGMLPPQAMVMQVPMGIPPPAPMLMVQQQSQGIMGSQPMPMVGGVPPIVPRTIPPVTTAIPNLKSVVHADSVLAASAPSVTTTAVGDATPTEEEGTNVSSPNIQKTIPNAVSAQGLPVSSTQPVTSVAQFNPILGLNANRPIISVPPPVSTAGTPIPYPPPNVGFNFPPPGIRPHGQAHTMPPNVQFPWMQKQMGSPFTDADSNHSATSNSVRPPPQQGMPPHMLLNRPPFHDPQASAPNIKSPMKDAGIKDKSNEVENPDNRNQPGQHDRSQEMVISTDDESSMDIEYPRNDMPPGFPPEFTRIPMNIPRMRGPPGPMPHHNPRFVRGMGSHFPMRMGGPRGMGAPGMHGRMDMDFAPHGPRGPRMPMGPHGHRRNDMHDMHHPHDVRDWYPRDFEPPHFERERDRRFRDDRDWGRESRDPWINPNDMDHDSRRSSRDSDDHRRDDRRESWNRERSDNRSSKDNNPVNESNEKQKNRSANKIRNTKSLMDDLFKYQKGGVSNPRANRSEQPKDKPIRKEDENKIEKPPDLNSEQMLVDKEVGIEQNCTSKRDKDKDSRKRSRWGRTLSEEREFQEQRRNEIEMKFQSYEKSHAAQLAVQCTSENSIPNPDDPSRINSNDMSQLQLPTMPETGLVNDPEKSEINEKVKNSSDDTTQILVDTVQEKISHTFKDGVEMSTLSSETEIDTSEVSIPNADQNSMQILGAQTHSAEVTLPITSEESLDLNTGHTLKELEACNLSKVDVHCEKEMIESKTIPCRMENDLVANNGVTNSTSSENENEGNVDTNSSSLLTAES